MSEIAVAAIVFVCLVFASLGAIFISSMLPTHHRSDDTNTIVRLLANLFVVMTSLVFGLMINSAKNTYESTDDSVHSFATNLILLDRTLRTYGLLATDARSRLVVYVREGIANPARADDPSKDKPDTAGRDLDALGDALAAITPADRYHEALLVDARQQYRRLVEQRWAIVEQSEGSIPMPLLAMLTAWMTLIFGSFGYRAPRNVIVIGSFVLSALLIAGAFYLVLSMDVPFSGLIQISDMPLRRALQEMVH
ncbi:hypothetical protein [Mesorhizobium sp. INR15]|uniref:bestrophin-like domain n=1 Tax=Mesorhizobium sp. INR15 TaxID=2654248 RepID=UPI00189696B8|nr:hypothetical protein [Mesorhizobium sp. INR15]QPC91743.1 DUF4239 domain-containing protein [Mesorhizobium sp. INR15]